MNLSKDDGKNISNQSIVVSYNTNNFLKLKLRDKNYHIKYNFEDLKIKGFQGQNGFSIEN